MKKIYACLLAIMMMLVGVFTACDLRSGGLEFKGSPTMQVEYNEYLGYSATITGTVVHNGFETLSYASVEFSIYDANGNNLGTAMDNINNLKPGDTWRFSANLFDFPETRPVRFEFAGFTAW